MSNNRKATIGRKFYMVPLYREENHPTLGKLLHKTRKTGKRTVLPQTLLFKAHDHIHTTREKQILRELKDIKGGSIILAETPEQRKLYDELRELRTPAILK